MARIIQCNVRSLNTSCKYVEDLCLREDIQALCLTEIWHPDVENLNFLQKWDWKVSVRIYEEGGGTAIITRPDVKCVPRKDITGDVEMSWCDVYINTKILVGEHLYST